MTLIVIPNVQHSNARTSVTAVQPELAASTRAHWRRHAGLKSCIYGNEGGGSYDEFIVVMMSFIVLTIVVGIGDVKNDTIGV